MPRLARLLALSALVSASSCEVAEAPPLGGDATRADTREVRDDAEVAEVAPEVGDGLVLCDPQGESANGGCPAEMFCETTARVCVDCVGRRQRCVDGRRETCEAPVATGYASVTGGFYQPDPCQGRDVCVPDGIFAQCLPRVCDPDPATWRCASATVAEQCNAYGTSEIETACGPGRACYGGQCELVRHNIVLVFDTSGSMHIYRDPTLDGKNPTACDPADGDPPCLQPFPVCDAPTDPLTLFTLSKTIFAEAIQGAVGSYAQFALQRFPQREDATNVNDLCYFGWYDWQTFMTGDDDAFATTEGGWFDQHRGEALVVPFPLRNNLDNSAALLEWLDFEERLGASDVPCEVSADCGTGQCGSVNGERRCFYHTDHELRAGGETPLGKSLYYAGEYIRRFVRVDGKPCVIDANCGSAGYQCVDNVCKDPYRACKDDFIVLFTDGAESEHKEETSFFNPVVQAKRLAYGLDCAGDGDCRGNATCQDGVCVPIGQSVAAMPRVVTGGFGALTSPDGQPISIKTTVITLNGKDSANARIALFGGGVSIDVSGTDAATFRERLTQAMSPNYKCQPEDL
ncbi:MAG: hypothetical protein IT385_18060 [Deltaproteobacteria bacterium]|nr:hypothetical protein [Deltaproteobacteria bacterium]